MDIPHMVYIMGKCVYPTIKVFGSGNGFTRYHKIPMRWKAALNVYKDHKEVICDTGTINGKHFVNVAGVGNSAHIA